MENQPADLDALLATQLPLGPQERRYLASLPLEIRTVPARRKLVHDGQRCEHLFLVQSGWLAGFKQLADGGRQIFNFWIPGEVAGIELLAYQRAPYAMMTLTASSLICVAREPLEQLKRELPELANFLTRLVARNGVILRQRMVSLGRRTAFSRIAHLLLELSLRLGHDIAPRPVTLDFPLTQQEIADCLGLTAPYVNRILRQMRERNLVRLGDDRLEIADLSRLAMMAEFSPDYLRVDTNAPAFGALPGTAAGDPATLAPSHSAAVQASHGRS